MNPAKSPPERRPRPDRQEPDGRDAQPQVLVIGGGIIGVSAAYYLACAGISVTLLEMTEIGAGSSWGNAGMIVPSHVKPLPGPGVLSRALKWMLSPESPFYIRPRLDLDLFRWLWHFRSCCNTEFVESVIPHLRDLGRFSMACLTEILNREAIECSFERRGGLELYLSRENFAHAADETAALRAHGVDVSLLDQQALSELEPALNPDVVGGMYLAEDAHLEPAPFVQGLADAAVKYGARVCTGVRVVGFDLHGGRIRRVRTEKREFRADQVVLAAGAWSTDLAHQAGVPLLMEAAKGYSITMKRPAVCPQIPLHLAEAGMAITPMGAFLRYAGTLELSGMSTLINSRRVKAIQRNAGDYLAESGPHQIKSVWSGMRPLPPDGLPFIGRTGRVENLILASGHGKLGISLGPGTGRLIRDLVCEREPELDLHRYDPDRFGRA